MKANWKRFFMAWAMVWSSFGMSAPLVQGFTLTEIGTHVYDASLDPANKTASQLLVDRLSALGVNHIILSPRATMKDPRQSFVVPMTSAMEQPSEYQRYMRLISYIQSKGMTVGIRPIFFVVDEFGGLPYVEVLPDGSEKVWWHGNIQPADPLAWFASFQSYLEIYARIAANAKIREFTVGAELESMTVGEAGVNPLGYPEMWIQLVDSIRPQLAAGTRIMYDINYTDDALYHEDGTVEYGGEFSRWRHRIVDPTSFPSMEAYKSWKALRTLWARFDAVGIDMYRSLMEDATLVPKSYPDLVVKLKEATDEFSDYLTWALKDIDSWVNKRTNLIIKEVGYKSVNNGFIDPFIHAGPGSLNVEHQAAAYEALLRTFHETPLKWYGGIAFWEASVDYSKHGPFDVGFSPIGKRQSERMLQTYFIGN